MDGCVGVITVSAADTCGRVSVAVLVVASALSVCPITVLIDPVAADLGRAGMYGGLAIVAVLAHETPVAVSVVLSSGAVGMTLPIGGAVHGGAVLRKRIGVEVVAIDGPAKARAAIRVGPIGFTVLPLRIAMAELKRPLAIKIAWAGHVPVIAFTVLRSPNGPIAIEVTRSKGIKALAGRGDDVWKDMRAGWTRPTQKNNDRTKAQE